MLRIDGGTCFAHGAFTGQRCPHFPTCASDPQQDTFINEGLDKTIGYKRDGVEASIGDLIAAALERGMRGERQRIRLAIEALPKRCIFDGHDLKSAARLDDVFAIIDSKQQSAQG